MWVKTVGDMIHHHATRTGAKNIGVDRKAVQSTDPIDGQSFSSLTEESIEVSFVMFVVSLVML